VVGVTKVDYNHWPFDLAQQRQFCTTNAAPIVKVLTRTSDHHIRNDDHDHSWDTGDQRILDAKPSRLRGPGCGGSTIVPAFKLRQPRRGVGFISQMEGKLNGMHAGSDPNVLRWWDLVVVEVSRGTKQGEVNEVLKNALAQNA